MDNFREWLSDNLRYILLIFGIALIALGLFFGIRFLSKKVAGQPANTAQDQVVSESEAAADSGTAQDAGRASVPEAPQESVSESEPALLSDDSGEAPALIEADTEVAEELPPGGRLSLGMVPEVEQSVTTYYQALASCDPDLARTVVENLPQDDAYHIADASPSEYTDLMVYTKHGPEADSYLVYADYKKKAGTILPIPELSELYVKKTSDDIFRIIPGEYDADLQAYADEVNAGEDIQALRAQNAAAREEALAAEAEAEKAAQEAAEAQAEAERLAAEQAAWEAEHRETPAYLKSTCHVRSGPGYEYGIVYVDLPGGTPVTVIGRTDAGWIHVKTDFTEGYVGGRFIGY